MSLMLIWSPLLGCLGVLRLRNSRPGRWRRVCMGRSGVLQRCQPLLHSLHASAKSLVVLLQIHHHTFETTNCVPKLRQIERLA